MENIPSGYVKIAMENGHFSWENPLFLWPFSIAMLNYQRVAIACYSSLITEYHFEDKLISTNPPKRSKVKSEFIVIIYCSIFLRLR
jgi:hypothetical protein